VGRTGSVGNVTKSALLIGGTGQIGWASAENLLAHGWDVTVASRTGVAGPEGSRPLALDRENTEDVVARSNGMDLVLDTVAFTPAHGEQLAGLAGRVGSLVVISTASVYLGDNGTYLDVATGAADFPVYPQPVTEDQPTVNNDEQTYSPLKAALERLLLATPDIPVSVLRPGAIHGPHSQFVREWFFIKRVLDNRPRVVLSWNGESRFGTSATVNIAELVRLCAEKPGARALNAADPVTPSTREIAEIVFRLLGHEAEIIGMPGEREGLGASPWGVPTPFVQSMDRARLELGYTPVASYAEAIAPTIEWFTEAVARAEASGKAFEETFPRYHERYGADSWFPYEAEDEYATERVEG
jgi:nucleoside-diphosphate-sugar epimerase